MNFRLAVRLLQTMIKACFISFSSLIYFLIISASLACPDSIAISPAFSSQTCVYRFTFANGSCSFIECRNRVSSTSPEKLLGWSECFSECCSEVADGLPASSDSIELLYSCESANAARRARFIGVLVGCFGFLVTLIIVGAICYMKKSCPLNRWFGKIEKTPEDSYTNNKEKKLPFHTIRPVAKVAENITSEELSNEHKEVTLSSILPIEFSPARSYFSSGDKNISLLEAKCMVCLQEKPNCQLNCSHNLHSNCLGLWFERNPAAAPCGDVNLKIVRVHCLHCLRKMGAKSIHKFKGMFKAGEESFRCQQCKNSTIK